MYRIEQIDKTNLVYTSDGLKDIYAFGLLGNTPDFKVRPLKERPISTIEEWILDDEIEFIRITKTEEPYLEDILETQGILPKMIDSSINLDQGE